MTGPGADILVSRRERERAVLVGVATGAAGRQHTEEHVYELSLLAESAGARVVHRMVQERHRIDPATFIGRGKAEELAWLVREKNVQLVVFDDDLSSVQVRNLGKLITCKIVDRSALILDIFASRARTREARTQVELAQLQYFLPRLGMSSGDHGKACVARQIRPCQGCRRAFDMNANARKIMMQESGGVPWTRW